MLYQIKCVAAEIPTIISQHIDNFSAGQVECKIIIFKLA